MNVLKRLFNLLLMRKSFNYTVQMSSQDCLQRLRDLSQRKIGFMNAISQSVFLTKEDRHFRFEVCIERYGRSGVYNAVKATGTIAGTIDQTSRTIVSGNIRFGIHFLAYPLLFTILISLIVMRTDIFWSYLGIIAITFTFILIYIARDFRDYRRLDALINNTFSREG